MGISDKNGREGRNAGKWQSSSKSVSWSDGSNEDIGRTVSVVTDSGAAILFTRTTDTSALVLKVFAGSEGCKEYCNNPGDIAKLLEWVRGTFG